jgi:CRISPR-associated protein Csb1
MSQTENGKVLTFETLQNAVTGTAAALRCRTVLQPAGGEGDKVFPPTYAGAVYAVEKRRVPGREEPVTCVLLDSVQSQANRMEEALQLAFDQGRITLPIIAVEFPRDGLLDDIGTITSLQAPHRVADAILRDSELDGVPFRQTAIGKKIDIAGLQNATPLFDVCPTALVFGLWDSTGPKGGLGAKFARAVVSEIIGYGAELGVKTSSRIDPLQIRAAVKVLKDKSGYRIADDKAKGAVSPSEVNHGNIPPDISAQGGVTIQRAEQTTVLSMPALRRLRFPIDGKTCDPAVDDAARTVLAALALCGAVFAAERGLDLRSRCLLWPTETLRWEILDKLGSTPEEVSIDADTALAVFNEAVVQAKTKGLPWREKPLLLKPSAKLVTLVRRSQELAVTEGGPADGKEAK